MGSLGVFRFAQKLEDADAVLAYLRLPNNAKRLEVDAKRLAIARHSMGDGSPFRPCRMTTD